MEQLHALPPQVSLTVAVGHTPFWLGSGSTAHHRVFHPNVRPRHAAIVERADGFWLVPGDGEARLNGRPIGSGALLTHGDVLELAAGCSFRFGDAVAPVVPIGEGVRQTAPRKQRRPRGLRTRVRIPPRAALIALGAAVMLVLAGGLLWRARQVGKPNPGELSIDQSMVLDSLLRETYDHIERGTALLSIGANAQALREFADGINVLQLHPLRSHPAVAPRILALEGAVAGIYRENSLAVPSGFAGGRASGALLSTALAASLTAADFRLRFEEVQARFRSRFGESLVVTGSDHTEHLSLYGPGGALDLRSRDLSTDRIQFIIAECRLRRIRVKDFSRDSVLRAQVAAARQAGLPDRAGTGVHLHIDRFAGRRDRWTVD